MAKKIDFNKIIIKIKQMPKEEQLSYLAIAIGFLLVIIALLIW
jgi:hypothetical protein